MDLDDPSVAQNVVAAYATLLQRRADEKRLPAPTTDLPYSRPVIKAAVATSLRTLRDTGQLTGELRDFLEEAYVRLSDFIDAELVRLLHDYNAAADGLTPERTAAERVQTAQWRMLEETGRLAGDIARRIADDAAQLREEFKAL